MDEDDETRQAARRKIRMLLIAVIGGAVLIGFRALSG
jgi:hypothetical protein